MVEAVTPLEVRRLVSLDSERTTGDWVNFCFLEWKEPSDTYEQYSCDQLGVLQPERSKRNHRLLQEQE